MGSSGSEEDGGDVTDNKTKRGFFGVICCIGAMRFFGCISKKILPSRMRTDLASQDRNRFILCPLLVSAFPKITPKNWKPFRQELQEQPMSWKICRTVRIKKLNLFSLLGRKLGGGLVTLCKELGEMLSEGGRFFNLLDKGIT